MVYKRFMVSYIIILMIPILISGYVYRYGLNVVEKDATETRLFMLRQMRDMVDRSLKEIDETKLRLINDPATNLMQQLDPPRQGTGDIYRFWDYNRVISKQTLTGNSIKSRVFVFFSKNGAVFSHNTTNFGYDFVYNHVLSYKNLSYEDWINAFFNDGYGKKYLSAREMTIDGEDASYITYLYSLPSEHATLRSGVMAFFINNDRIKELLNEVNLNGDGWVCITDSQGNVITGVTQGEYSFNTIKLDNRNKEGFYYDDSEKERVIVLYTKSNYNDWNFIIGLPYSSILGELFNYRRIIVLVLLITAFLGMILSAFFSYKNGKPLHETAKIILDSLHSGGSRNKNRKDEVDILCGGVRDLIENNEDLKEKLENQMKTLRNSIIDQILKGDINSTKKIGVLLNHLGIYYTGKIYQVGAIRINRYDQIMNREILNEQDLVRLVIEEEFNSGKKNGNGFVHYKNQNEIAILFMFEPENHRDRGVEEMLKKLCEKIQSLYNIRPDAGVGTATDELLSISKSYNEARYALGRINSRQEHILSYDSIEVEVVAYYYPQDLEYKLINLTKSGSMAEVNSILSDIYRRNFKNPNNDTGLQKILLLDMWATLIKINDELGLSEVSRVYPRAAIEEFEESRFYSQICESYKRICQRIENDKKSHNFELKEAIRLYLNDNYSNPMLCVAMISSRFHLSESYFSQFFKEQLGENFGTYLEKLRIEKACGLILDGNMIDSIALDTGYNSPHSFRRAFKRTKGMSPSSFREIKQERGEQVVSS